MPQQPKPDETRAARARTVAIRLADVLDGEGTLSEAQPITWPRFLELTLSSAEADLVAGMLPPAPSVAAEPGHEDRRIPA